MSSLVEARFGHCDRWRSLSVRFCPFSEGTPTGSTSNFPRVAFDPFGGRRAANWLYDITAQELSVVQAQQLERTGRGFTDHEHTNRTALIHMNGRVYDPRIGRFLSVDPVVADPESSQDWNPYAYVNNNPLRATDPTGYWWESCCEQDKGFFYFGIGSLVLSENPHSLREFIWNVENTAGERAQAEMERLLAAQRHTHFALGHMLAPDEPVIQEAGIRPPILVILVPVVREAARQVAKQVLKRAERIERERIRRVIAEKAAREAAEAARAARGVPKIKPGSAGGPTAGQRFPESVRDAAKAENPTARCVFCRRPGTATQVDHAIPRVRGGNATPDNAQLACPHCNASKGAGDFPKSPPPGYTGPWPP